MRAVFVGSSPLHYFRSIVQSDYIWFLYEAKRPGILFFVVSVLHFQPRMFTEDTPHKFFITPHSRVQIEYIFFLSGTDETWMKDDTRWKLKVGIGLVTLSIVFYAAHYLIFHDEHHLFIFFIGDLAFIPVEVLIVTLIIDQMLESREKQQRIEKLNMVIGTFFSTIGTSLLFLLLKTHYPYLFSLAMRTNPFDSSASVVIR
jgi:hypothetical protein